MAQAAPLGRKRRTVLMAVSVAALVLLLAAGFAYVNSRSVARLAANARALHWANASSGASALARAGLVQAVTFAELDSIGIAAPEDDAFAMEQLNLASDELHVLVDEGEARTSQPQLVTFSARVDEAISLLEEGDFGSAKELVRTTGEAAYIDLVDALQSEQQQISDAIDANSAAGRAVNSWVVFILTLAVPASAIGVYFVVTRRQMASYRERVRSDLEAERAAGRAKDEFIVGLSYQLRTPLTSIFGYAAILSDGGIKGMEAVQETGEIIADEAAEMTRIVDDLLVASQISSSGLDVNLEPVRVEEVIESAITPYRRAGRTIQREPTRAWANADPGRLRHVLVNLLSNAVEHGGSSVGVNVSTGDQWVEIEVWDNGSGLPTGTEDSFHRYVTEDGHTLLAGSEGLGLAVAANLTTLMGGELKYQRFNGRSYFVVTLQQPRQPQQATNGEQGEPAAAEDEEDVAAMIRALSA